MEIDVWKRKCFICPGDCRRGFVLVDGVYRYAEITAPSLRRYSPRNYPPPVKINAYTIINQTTLNNACEKLILVIDVIKSKWKSTDWMYIALMLRWPRSLFLSFLLILLSLVRQHTLPSCASADACLTGWPNAQDGTSAEMGIEPNPNRTNRTRTHILEEPNRTRTWRKHIWNSNRTKPINVTNPNRTRTFWPRFLLGSTNLAP